jgi:hypothetical protein
MEMWNVDDPAKPFLICETKVDYGENNDAHNEMGYVLGTQPCIFGPGAFLYIAHIQIHTPPTVQ